MAKRETKETYKDIKGSQGTADQQGGNQASQNAEETKQAGSDIGKREDVRGLYGGLATGDTPNVSGVSGRIDTGRLGDVYGKYRGLADTGGYSPEDISGIKGDVSGLREMGRTGGIDSESMGRFRGNGVFDEFSKTGGLSAADRGNIKARALRPVSAMASNTRDELARRRSVQGGFSPGFDSSSRALQRDTARGIADTSLNANLGIMDRVNQGRQWGAEGASNSEGNLQTLRTGNQYRGLTGASDIQMGLNNSIFGNKMSALGGARGSAGDIAGIEGQNIGYDFANRGIEGQNIDRNLDSKYRGVGGLGGMASGDMERYQRDLDRGNSIYGQKNQVNQGYYGQRNPLATQPGAGGNIVKGIGAAAGAIGAAYLGGRGGGGGGTTFPPPGGNTGVVGPRYQTFAGT